MGSLLNLKIPKVLSWFTGSGPITGYLSNPGWSHWSPATEILRTPLLPWVPWQTWQTWHRSDEVTTAAVLCWFWRNRIAMSISRVSNLVLYRVFFQPIFFNNLIAAIGCHSQKIPYQSYSRGMLIMLLPGTLSISFPSATQSQDRTLAVLSFLPANKQQTCIWMISSMMKLWVTQPTSHGSCHGPCL